MWPKQWSEDLRPSHAGISRSAGYSGRLNRHDSMSNGVLANCPEVGFERQQWSTFCEVDWLHVHFDWMTTVAHKQIIITCARACPLLINLTALGSTPEQFARRVRTAWTLTASNFLSRWTVFYNELVDRCWTAIAMDIEICAMPICSIHGLNAIERKFRPNFGLFLFLPSKPCGISRNVVVKEETMLCNVKCVASKLLTRTLTLLEGYFWYKKAVSCSCSHAPPT